MKNNKTDIFRGSLIASIMHAIMTNKYPDLSYEQSWDESNYSIQNSSGLRGTITFCSEFCIGAIRNDNYSVTNSEYEIQQYMNGFPLNVIQKANEETLQYLLLNKNGIIVPCVTSVFWADENNIHFEKRFIENIKRDFSLLEDILLPEEEAIDKWINYYEMNSDAIQLFNEIYQFKTRDFAAKLILSEKQKKLIPGASINSECIESLMELNICFKD